MILIFGGTTEGRHAVDVCEQAGQQFYYSTKGSGQDIEMHYGVRLYGSMTTDDIVTFCHAHSISCIIDAAHPFAENLHRAIEDTTLPVIRYQRTFSPHREGVTYCSDYSDAISKMKEAHIKKLLALSGVNTISKLKDYWTKHLTTFRILNRQESIAIAEKNGFPLSSIIYYSDTSSLPTIEQEKQVMTDAGCDAIITKESGDSGGFDTKIDAALQLGLAVFVVTHPQLPKRWTYVTGKHGLRRAIETLAPSFFPLKTGLTTGACATAATKAAVLSLLFDEYPEEVSFAIPDGETLTIPVYHESKGTASVVKDFSDDPDITKGCRITSKAELAHRPQSKAEEGIRFLPGKGVGTVTLPGLGIPVGEPAINPTPRRMITEEIRSLTSEDIDVTISVENGEELARKTFNNKVGVMGGISIIGTSGIVHPLSNEAFISSIRRELEVAWAIGEREVALVAGKKSEEALKQERDIRCVHYGNFIGAALQYAHDIGFRRITLAIMIGKAVKLAEGHLDTHSHKVEMNKTFLCSVAQALGINAAPIGNITMARDLWGIMPQAFFDKISALCLQHCKSVFPQGEIQIRLISCER